MARGVPKRAIRKHQQRQRLRGRAEMPGASALVARCRETGKCQGAIALHGCMNPHDTARNLTTRQARMPVPNYSQPVTLIESLASQYEALARIAELIRYAITGHSV